MRIITILLLFCFFGCENKKNSTGKPETTGTETSSPNKEGKKQNTIEHVCKSYYVGDINNDKIGDTATVVYNWNPELDEIICPVRSCPVTLTFSGAIPEISIGQSLGVFVKKTKDLNQDSANEVLLFSRTNEGYWENIFLWTFKNGEWKEMAGTKCFFSDDTDAENRIIKERNEFFLLGDGWDDSKGGVVKRSLKVKIE